MEASRKMTDRQRAMIFSLANKAKLEKDALYDVVRKVTGQEHISEMTVTQAKMTIDYLMQAIGQGVPLGWATSAQRGTIFGLCRELGWVTETGGIDMARLRGFVQARFHVDRLEWVRVDGASKIIEALKAMARGGRGERRAATK